MPGERLSMRKIREVLRLRMGHKLPQRAVAQSLRVREGRSAATWAAPGEPA